MLRKTCKNEFQEVVSGRAKNGVQMGVPESENSLAGGCVRTSTTLVQKVATETA